MAPNFRHSIFDPLSYTGTQWIVDKKMIEHSLHSVLLCDIQTVRFPLDCSQTAVYPWTLFRVCCRPHSEVCAFTTPRQPQKIPIQFWDASPTPLGHLPLKHHLGNPIYTQDHPIRNSRQLQDTKCTTRRQASDTQETKKRHQIQQQEYVKTATNNSWDGQETLQRKPKTLHDTLKITQRDPRRPLGTPKPPLKQLSNSQNTNKTLLR